MKLEQKMLHALNEQVVKELYSAYLYRSMKSDMKNAGWCGYSHWLDAQYKEEIEHAEKIADYIEDRAGVVEFGAIEAIGNHFDCPIEAAKAALSHEEYISESIRGLFKLARELGDIETEIFLQWFITEQIEEEASAKEVVDGFSAAEGCKAVMRLYDAKLGDR